MTGALADDREVPDPDDPATDAVVARHARTLPGWAARWDARIVTARGRLARRAPRLHRLLLAWLFATYLVVEVLLPTRRVVPLAWLMVAATLLDSAATYLWVSRQMAVEGNPVVESVMATFGAGPGLALRAALSVSFVVLLTWLARRHWEARAGMVVAATALAGVTAIHGYGLVLLLGI